MAGLTLCRVRVHSPLGPLLIEASARGIRRCTFDSATGPAADAARAMGPGSRHVRCLLAQLRAYFAGRRARFTVPIDLSGTPFQRRVWQAMRHIPCGAVETYGGLARRLAARASCHTPPRPMLARAIGQACAANPIAIVIPCHRVLAADGSLRGYGGGLERKRRLLHHEARFVRRRARRLQGG